MNMYTAKDRVIAALKRQYADRVPTTLCSGLML